jgi:uncharacterized protein (TIGR02646 family)
MRAITKGVEPRSLTAHRQTAHCDYDNYPSKEDLRQALVAEQGALCCYCMGRIRGGPTTMKIEHWRCQARHPGQQLMFRNLLGACRGGEGQPVDLQHCDTRKGDRDLLWNPADPEHHIETRIQYGSDGTIQSEDPVFDSHLNDVLNLNEERIRSNRKSVLTALLEWWNKEKPVPRARIEREIAKRVNPGGDLAPYCQVAVWWLQQRHARMG